MRCIITIIFLAFTLFSYCAFSGDSPYLTKAVVSYDESKSDNNAPKLKSPILEYDPVPESLRLKIFIMEYKVVASTPTSTPSCTPTLTHTSTASPSATETSTPTASLTATVTYIPTDIPSIPPTVTPTPSITCIYSPTLTPTLSPSPFPTPSEHWRRLLEKLYYDRITPPDIESVMYKIRDEILINSEFGRRLSREMYCNAEELCNIVSHNNEIRINVGDVGMLLVDESKRFFGGYYKLEDIPFTSPKVKKMKKAVGALKGEASIDFKLKLLFVERAVEKTENATLANLKKMLGLLQEQSNITHQ